MAVHLLGRKFIEERESMNQDSSIAVQQALELIKAAVRLQVNWIQIRFLLYSNFLYSLFTLFFANVQMGNFA